MATDTEQKLEKSKQQIIADILGIYIDELEKNIEVISIPDCWHAMETYAKIYHKYKIKKKASVAVCEPNIIIEW